MQCCLINKILDCPRIFKYLRNAFEFSLMVVLTWFKEETAKSDKDNRTGKFLFGTGFGDKILGQYWYFYLLQSSEKLVPET